MWRLSLSLAVFLVGHLLASEPMGECESRAQLPSVENEIINTVDKTSLGDCGKKSDKVWWAERGKHTPTINAKDALLVTVATNETDGFKRFRRSAETYDFPLKVLGMGQLWKGGDMQSTGGGFKINLFKKYLEDFKDDANKIIMFTDSYDVILLAGMDKILEVFEQFDARVVFSAEGFCWPDRSLASKYPTAPRGKRYLNSGGFIGYAPEIYQIVTSSVVADTDDDQLFYTKVFLDEELRVKYNIKLDHKSEIFQNLNGAVDDVELRFNEDTHEAFLQNTVSGTTPLVIHGNGPSKLVLLTLGNYLARGWNTKDGCVECWDKIMPLNDVDLSLYPTVLIAVFIEAPSAFLQEFLEKIYNLNYPKNKLDLFVHNNVPYHVAEVEKFLEKHRDEYRSVKTYDPSDNIPDEKARTLALEYSETKKCDFYFNIDSEAHLDNPHTLKLLIEQNRTIIAPVLVRPHKLWSNFWGAMTTDGFYARSMDYMQIIHNERRGVWSVPYIRSCYLLNSTIFSNPLLRPIYEQDQLDSDMAFCNSMRDKDLFMFVSNRFDYGHLVDSNDYDPTRTNPEVYELFNNRYDWEQRYIHENYTENLNPNKTSEQPCPDVFWFPVVTERFCKEFIEIMEAFGKWSDGTNHDDRLEGGYENVPTRDIHMKQVGLDPVWMHFLKEYVRPMQERTFIGYFNNDERIQGGYENVPTRDIHMNQVGLEELWAEFLMEYVRPLQRKEFVGYLNPPRSLMNFVVRYRPDEQPSLRPHHDSSTYTINLALNRPEIDFQGGGCRFLRYNCSVTNTRVGWLLMHPGRLTHYHEGLLVTNGTRYIMISFVDP